MSLFPALSIHRREIIYQKIADFLEMGSNPISIIEDMARNAHEYGSRKEAAILARWHSRLRDGHDFGEATKGDLPEQEWTLIKAGATTGNLKTALTDALILTTVSSQLKKSMIGYVYPALVLAGAQAYMLVFTQAVVPTLVQLAGDNARWRGLAAMVIWVNNYIVPATITFYAAIAVLVTFLVWALPNWTPTYRLVLDRLPIFSLYRLLVGSSFLMSVGKITAAGVRPEEAIALLREGSTPYLHERLSAFYSLIKAGRNMGEALTVSGYNFPDREIIGDLSFYAKSGTVATRIDDLTQKWLSRRITATQQQSVRLRSYALLVAALLMGITLFSLYDMTTQMQANMRY